MQFAHEHHQRTYENVREYLKELFEETFEDEEGHFYVRYGSTVIEISAEPYGPEEASVAIVSYCVQGADIDDELLRNLLRLNHTLPFGSFSVVDEDIFFSHTLFGRTLERSNLLGAVAAVAEIADEYDDYVLATKYSFHGGVSIDTPSDWTIEPRAIYFGQGENASIILGTNFKYDFIESDGVALHLGGWLRSSKSTRRTWC